MIPAFMRTLATCDGAFGCVAVLHDTVHDAHILLHGDTFHGWQFLDPAHRDDPTGYYAHGSPIAALIASLSPDAAIAVAGLGAGVMAALLAPGQSMTFFEIDPAVLTFAHDARYFTFLARSRGRCEVVRGDAIDRLLACPPASYDLVVMDAFVDAEVPGSVRTPAVVAGLAARLRPGGLLAFHVTSTKRGDDLRPALAAVAGDLACASIDWASARLPHDPDLEIAPEVDLTQPVECRWVVMGDDAAVARVVTSGWTALTPSA
jgi:hypothetical protein